MRTSSILKSANPITTSGGIGTCEQPNTHPACWELCRYFSSFHVSPLIPRRWVNKPLHWPTHSYNLTHTLLVQKQSKIQTSSSLNSSQLCGVPSIHTVCSLQHTLLVSAMCPCSSPARLPAPSATLARGLRNGPEEPSCLPGTVS